MKVLAFVLIGYVVLQLVQQQTAATSPGVMVIGNDPFAAPSFGVYNGQFAFFRPPVPTIDSPVTTYL